MQDSKDAVEVLNWCLVVVSNGLDQSEQADKTAVFWVSRKADLGLQIFPPGKMNLAKSEAGREGGREGEKERGGGEGSKQ